MAVKGMTSEAAIVQDVSVGEGTLAGATAGMIGAVMMTVFAMGVAVMNGMDTLSPVRLIGATFIGTGALEGGIAVIVYGLLLHIVTAMIWGVLFALMLPRSAPAGAALIAGLLYGLIVMLIMLYLVLPVANPVMRQAVDGTTAFTIEHLIYGGALALVPMLRGRSASQAR